MMKNYLKFLIFSWFCNLLADSKSLLLHNLLVTLLKTCDLNSKKILIYDVTSETFNAIANLQPQVSALLFSDHHALTKLRYYQSDDLDLDVVILVIIPMHASEMMNHLFMKWRYNRNCIIYIFPIILNDCENFRPILEWIMRFYFLAVYYICLINNFYMIAHTFDSYGDTQPLYWTKIDQGQSWNKNRTLYFRTLSTRQTDMSELCIGFNFKRTDPSNQLTVAVGIRSYQVNDKYFVQGKNIYGAEIEADFKRPHNERIRNIKRLLKVQFEYYLILYGTQGYTNFGIDTIICEQSFVKEKNIVHFFHPVEYESFAIMSHDRGLMTPLEKIAEFYGIWTLTSLTAMLSIIFIVIWFITKKISLALFDVIRLLINSGITVPIDTWPRKIFFSMIFLYFMIIHATFSGHLAEFLTKVEHRQNIESIEELKDPGIKRIYNFGYQYDDTKEFDILRRKSVDTFISGEFIRRAYDTDHPLIAPLVVINMVWIGIENKTFYISRNTFGLALISSTHRPGFPLSEKFNWAFMYLFDTGLIANENKKHHEKVVIAMARQTAANDVHHRAITVSNLYFAFIVLITGNSIAFICFLVEISLKIIFKMFESLQ